MKLRNFVYAAMIACAFASCSKDDENVPTPDGKGDGSLSIAISLAEPSTLRADGNALTGEDLINEIQVAIYDVNDGNKLLATANTFDKSGDKHIATFTGLPLTKVKCVVLANMKEAIKIADYKLDNTNTVAITGETFASNALPMYGISAETLLTATTTTNPTNVIPVSVYRNVARVQISNIQLDMTRKNEQGVTMSGYKSGTAKFDLKSVSVNSASATSLVNGAYDAAASYVYGWAGFVSGAVKYAYYYKDAAASETVTQVFTEATTVASPIPGLVSDGKSKYYFYVFGNEKTTSPSFLTIAGEFSLTNAVANDGTEVESLAPVACFYPIYLGYSGVASNPELKVVKNQVYDIALTIVGAGYDKPNPGPDPENPDFKKANVQVVATAAPWAGKVTQAPVIQ